MSKLKRLDGKGRLWPQQMIMDVQRGYLVLSDIETKVRLRIPHIRGQVIERAWRQKPEKRILSHPKQHTRRLRDTV